MNNKNIKISLRKALTFSLFLITSLILSQGNIHAEENKAFKEATNISKKAMNKYFAAYFDLDFKRMKKLMHDDISFDDPTARFVFGGDKIVGKNNVYNAFKKAYASIIEIKQTPIRTIYSSNVGVFEVDISYKFRDGPDKIITINMPLVIILTYQDGKIIEHRDYADYHFFLEQYNDQRS